MPTREGWRYEIIDGELHASKAPDWQHQFVSDNTVIALEAWSRRTGAGRTVGGPGLVFAEDDDVVPDVAWISAERLPDIWDESGHLRAAPDLVLEVLSPGRANERRDRDDKLGLYSRRGVREYWIVDWRTRQVELHRRAGEALRLVASLGEAETIESPLLPGFRCPVADLLVGIEPA